MDFFEKFYEILGIVGIPLLLVALCAVFISVKIYVKLWFENRQFLAFFNEVERGNAEKLFAAGTTKNPLIKIVKEAAKKLRSRDNFRQELAFLFQKNFYKTTRSFTTLRLIAVCSPLLGLLGTVIGIIQVFSAISSGGNVTAANQTLALGIGQALYTTVFGIVIALPTLTALSFLRHKVLGLAISVAEFAEKAVEIAEKNSQENR